MSESGDAALRPNLLSFLVGAVEGKSCQHSPSPLGSLGTQSLDLRSCFLTSPMYHFSANNTQVYFFHSSLYT